MANTEMDPNEEGHGEIAEVGAEVFAERLDAEVQAAREMGVESHTRIVDTEQREHIVELGEDVEKVEAEGSHVLIWLRNIGIVTATGAAVVGAIAVIRHRRKTKSS